MGARYVGWKGVVAVFHRGYWLVASLYLVLDAQLSAFQLVVIGTAQGLISVVAEVPAGVLADTFSRKWSLVAAQVLMGSAMAVTGLVTTFPALVATQMAWGVAWTLVSGLVTIALGGWIAARFPERTFTPVPAARWRASVAILRRGVELSRRDRVVLTVFASTFLVNGAGEAFGRLYTKQLVVLGFPAEPDPMVWYTALGLVVLLLGAAALRLVEARIERPGSAPVIYGAACGLGALGVTVLAVAPDAASATVGILLVGGLSMTVTRAVATIWLNRRTSSDVRATVHSLLAQAEYSGEIVCGFGLAVVARSTTISTALLGAAVLMIVAALLVTRPLGDPIPGETATRV